MLCCKYQLKENEGTQCTLIPRDLLNSRWIALWVYSEVDLTIKIGVSLSVKLNIVPVVLDKIMEELMLSTITRMIEVHVDLIQLRLRSVTHLPAIVLTSSSGMCDCCVERSLSRIRIINGCDRSTLKLRLCSTHSDLARNAIKQAQLRLKCMAREYVESTPMFLRSRMYRICGLCNKSRNELHMDNGKSVFLCYSCGLTIKWNKYRWVFMVMYKNTVSDMYPLIQSYLQLNESV